MTENYVNTATREPWIEYLLDQLHITSCPRYGNALHGLYIETGEHQGQRPPPQSRPRTLHHRRTPIHTQPCPPQPRRHLDPSHQTRQTRHSTRRQVTMANTTPGSMPRPATERRAHAAGHKGGTAA